MFSDTKINTQAIDLSEFYQTLFNEQSRHHGDDYMLVHREIRVHLADCDSYTELGTNQGTTLALAMFQGLSKVRGYDITLDNIKSAEPHFLEHAKKCNIDYKMIQADSLKCTIEETDMLYIDSVHRYPHLKQELALHADKVQKYIVFHDTIKSQGSPDLRTAVLEFVMANSQWHIITDCNIDVGFMTVKRG